MVLSYQTEFSTVQNFSSLEEDRKAWDRSVWSPRARKQLVWPNVPPQADLMYDPKPDMEEQGRTSPRRYKIMSSGEPRFATYLSLQAGDGRYSKIGPADTVSLGPGSYDPKKAAPDPRDVARTGTSSFAAPDRPQLQTSRSPDTSQGPLSTDKKAWSRGTTIPALPRDNDVSLWRYPRGRVMKDKKPVDLPFYETSLTKNGSRSTLFGEVCASPQTLRASMASSTDRFLQLPNSRTTDQRRVRGFEAQGAGAKEKVIQSKIWDGRNWVLPAQFMRENSAAMRQAHSSPGTRRSRKSSVANLGKLSKPVSADGLHLFTQMRQDLQSSAVMRSQGHFTRPTAMLMDSSLIRRSHV